MSGQLDRRPVCGCDRGKLALDSGFSAVQHRGRGHTGRSSVARKRISGGLRRRARGGVCLLRLSTRQLRRALRQQQQSGLGRGRAQFAQLARDYRVNRWVRGCSRQASEACAGP